VTLPSPENWVAILQSHNITDEIFGAQLTFAYQFDRDLSARLAAWTEAMPLEERILLILILNLSWAPVSRQ
jgi:hypothetical protein